MKRARIVELDKRFVWHPYTQMKRYVEEVDPFVIARARGARLFDEDGRSYLDANSSWWVAALGHGHPRLVRALSEQAGVLAHTSLAGVTHGPVAELAEALVACAPRGLTRVFFSDDGSTAIEAAIKMAIGAQQRRGERQRTAFLSLGGAFHGETLGVTALGGVELFRRSFQSLLMPVHFLTPPSMEEAPGGEAAAALEALFDLHGGELAAAVVEPLVQGATGMRFYPRWFLELLGAHCKRRGVLLIVDEVFTGYGRTGPFWASSAAEVEADIVCTAKAFSGGMLPMAATLVREEIYQAFWGEPDQALFYGHSFAGNPLGARVALEVLRVFEDEAVLAGVSARAARIAETFTRLGQLPGAHAPRSLGMIGAVDLSPGGSYLGGAGWRVFSLARERGAYLRPLGDVVYVAPPLNIPLADLDELLSIVEQSVRDVLTG